MAVPKKKNGEPATELTDLDVDRVDGVDNPATGRAFALFKSALAPVVSKAVGAREEKKTVEKNDNTKVSFANLILGAEQQFVSKAADQAEFEFVDGVIVRRDPFLTFDSPKPSDGLRAPQITGAPFPQVVNASIVDRKASDVPMVQPLADYDFVEPSEQDLTAAGTMPSELFLTPGAGETKTPANFQAPQPKNRPMGASAGFRVGDGYILKSECGVEQPEEN